MTGTSRGDLDAALDAGAVAGLAALAFGSAPGAARGKHLAFLPPELLELELSDAEQRDFGDYELLERLGQGGMGVVYRARQKSLQRDVALKLLSAGPWASVEFIERFRREAQSAARLQHPNIVSIHEIGQHAELDFFSMELVRGRNLERHIEECGPLSPVAAARLLRRLAEALDYAHRLGVLHLDLKPGNVLLGEDGEPRIADFGLARRLGEALAEDGAEISGTPGYMAPEQARGDAPAIGVATDIHGLGTILYEALYGRAPFVGATAREILAQVVRDEAVPAGPPVRGRARDLEAICLKCLAREPARRYATARELAEDLGRFLDGRPVRARPLGAARRIARWARREPRVALAAAAAILSVLAGLAATTVQWRRAEAQSMRAEQTTARVRESLWQNRSDDSNRLLGEGRLAEALPNLLRNLEEQTASGAAAEAQRERLRIGSILDEVPRPIDSIALGGAPLNVRLDPRGRWVAVAMTLGEARRYDIDSGTLRWKRQLDVRAGPYLTLADDGRHLLAPHLGRLGMGATLIDVETGEERTPPAPLEGLFGAAFARDGLHALVGSTPAANGAPRMQLVEVGTWRPLGPPIARHPGMALLAPGGRYYALYARDPDHTISTSPGGCEEDRVCVADTRSGRVVWRYHHAPGRPLQFWRFSPDGRHLAAGFGNGETVLFDVASGAVERLQPQPAASVGPTAFDAGGAWFGATYQDGTIQVWNMADRSLVAPPWRIDAQGLIGIDLYPERRLVATHNVRDGDRLWRLPGEERPAIGLLRRPGMAQPVGFAGTDFAPAANLIAAAAQDGELRLWRYRDRRPLAARGAPLAMPDARNRIDARHVLDVRGAVLQRRHLADGTPSGVPIHLPQAAGFAQLVPDQDWIVASAGHRIHVRHGGDGSERYAPLELPASPSALLVDAGGRRLVAAWNATDRARRHLLVLRSIDFANGRTLAETHLVGPAYRLQLAESGDALLAWRYGELHVFELDTLRERFPAFRVGTDAAAFWQEHEAEDGDRTITLLSQLEAGAVLVGDARIGRDGRVLWVATRPAGGTGHRLLAIDAHTGGTLREWPLPAGARGLQPYEDGAAAALVLPAASELRLYRLDAEPHVIGLGSTEFFYPPRLALDRDERRLAVRLGNGIRWFETARGDWLSATVGMPQSYLLPRGAIDLGMDAGGEHVLLGTGDGTLWAFAARPDLRPLADLQREIALVAVQESSPSTTGFLPPRDPALRARLRAADPGPPDGQDVAPGEPVIGAGIDVGPIEARDAGAIEPRFVDLRPHCNLPPGELRRIDVGPLPPPGRQRLLGIDFELRCAVMARQAWNRVPDVASGSRVEGIAVRLQHVAAVELLAFGAGRLKGERRETYANFEFDYADGSRARVPIRNRDQMQAWFGLHLAGDASPLRVAWVGLVSQEWSSMPALTTPSLYAVRVENPHPERSLRSFALESVPQPWSMPVLLAATLVPPADAGAPPARAAETAR